MGKHSDFSLSKAILRSEFPRYLTPTLCHIIQRFVKLSNAGPEHHIVIIVTVSDINTRQARTHAVG